MWYVIWTATGSERKLCSWIKEQISSELYEDCFVALVENKRKVSGEWKSITKPLFPGYLFIDTDDQNIQEIAGKIRRFDRFAVVLSTDGEFTPVKQDEVYIINRAYSDDGVLGSSVGVIEDGNFKILSGPLTGHESAIKKVNRHKRQAVIELNLFGRLSRIIIGLEIISKT